MTPAVAAMSAVAARAVVAAVAVLHFLLSVSAWPSSLPAPSGSRASSQPIFGNILTVEL